MKSISCRFGESIYKQINKIKENEERKSLNNTVNVLIKEALKARDKAD